MCPPRRPPPDQPSAAHADAGPSEHQLVDSGTIFTTGLDSGQPASGEEDGGSLTTDMDSGQTSSTAMDSGPSADTNGSMDAGTIDETDPTDAGTVAACLLADAIGGCPECVDGVVTCSFESFQATMSSCGGCQAEQALYYLMCEAEATHSAEDIQAGVICENYIADGGTSGSADTDSDPSDSGSTVASGPITVELQTDGSYLCRPSGDGPFPAVLYNHGGLANFVGGDLEGSCRALAENGYLAFSKQRPLSQSSTIAGHLDAVLNALAALRANPDTDTTRVGIMGFSRGGLLALHAAIEKHDDIHAVVIMAPAPGGGPTTLDDAMANLQSIDDPVRILVSENDGPPAQNADHVVLCENLHDDLIELGKESVLTVYEPFGDDGHKLFFEVREPYWSDVLSFFAQALD